MKWKWLALVPFIISCSHITIKRGGENRGPDGEVHEYKLNSFIIGLINDNTVPQVSEICAHTRVASIEMKMAPADVLLTLVTLGIYVPHRIHITCASSS